MDITFPTHFQSPQGSPLWCVWETVAPHWGELHLSLQCSKAAPKPQGESYNFNIHLSDFVRKQSVTLVPFHTILLKLFLWQVWQWERICCFKYLGSAMVMGVRGQNRFLGGLLYLECVIRKMPSNYGRAKLKTMNTQNLQTLWTRAILPGKLTQDVLLRGDKWD